MIGDPVVWLVLLAAAVSGFCAGWAARGDCARKYQDSQDRYHAGRLAAQLAACEQDLAQAYAVQPPAAVPAVVHVHLDLPALHQGWPQQQVIDAQVIPALTTGETS